MGAECPLKICGVVLWGCDGVGQINWSAGNRSVSLESESLPGASKHKTSCVALPPRHAVGTLIQL